MKINCPVCHQPLEVNAGPGVARRQSPYRSKSCIVIILPEHYVESPKKTWTGINGKDRMIDYRLRCAGSEAEVMIV